MKKVIASGLAAAAATAALIGAAPAHAEVTWPGTICTLLDQNPTKGMITEITTYDLSNGVTPRQVAQTFGQASNLCPQHRKLIARTMNEYARGGI